MELGFYKAWHTLLFSILEPAARYHVRLDARQLQKHTRLQELQDVLNARGRRDRGFDYRCCDRVEGADSKKDDLIQVADLLTGAVGFISREEIAMPPRARESSRSRPGSAAIWAAPSCASRLPRSSRGSTCGCGSRSARASAEKRLRRPGS